MTDIELFKSIIPGALMVESKTVNIVKSYQHIALYINIKFNLKCPFVAS